MKKIFALLLALLMTLSLVACGEKDTGKEDAGNTDTNVEDTTGGKEDTTGGDAEVDDTITFQGEPWTMQTTKDAPVYTVGTIDKTKFVGPVLVTSLGQSTDAAMLDTVMKKAGVEYTYNATATKDDMAGYKTVIFAVGASTKGLGAAGVSGDSEKARASAMVAEADAQSMAVIVCHLGGATRRGGLSDELSELTMGSADYVVVKEDGNADSYFTIKAAAVNAPATMVYSTKNTIEVFTDLFAA